MTVTAVRFAGLSSRPARLVLCGALGERRRLAFARPLGCFQRGLELLYALACAASSLFFFDRSLLGSGRRSPQALRLARPRPTPTCYQIVGPQWWILAWSARPSWSAPATATFRPVRVTAGNALTKYDRSWPWVSYRSSNRGRFHSPEKAKAESLLKVAIADELGALSTGQRIMLKLTLP